MTTFETQIDDFIKKTNGKADKLLRNFSIEILSKVRERTPYKTGFARASWYATLNDPDATGEAGKNTLASAIASISGAKWGDVVMIGNNAKYARALEFGHSKKQAPNGMVRVTMAESIQILERIASEIGGQ